MSYPPPLDVRDLRAAVIRPTLMSLDLWSAAAEDLVLGTAAQESGLAYLRQIGGGPALGLWQIEPATHDDLWASTLSGRPVTRLALQRLAAPAPDLHSQLITNLAYGAAVCRLLYWRIAAPLPAAGDVAGYAAYWKRWYNTPAGAGTEAEFIKHWSDYRCAG